MSQVYFEDLFLMKSNKKYFYSITWLVVHKPFKKPFQYEFLFAQKYEKVYSTQIFTFWRVIKKFDNKKIGAALSDQPNQIYNY
jgi:hypothetical protein